MFRNPFSNPFGTAAMKRSRNLFGTHTTPREWKHGARDIPFGTGAMSLYVDGTDGSDSNDGESWKTAKATIQEAVDTADSWTQIFVKAATYAENVTINKENISLIGEKEETTIIEPVSNTPLIISTNHCNVTGITGKTVGTYAIRINGNHNSLSHCIGDGNQITIYGTYNEIDQCESTERFSIVADHTAVHDCTIDSSSDHGIYIAISHYNQIYNNVVKNCTSTGIHIDIISAVTPTYNHIFHNNLINNSPQIIDDGTTNNFYENFYDDHTNINNGHGIATEPYAFTGGIDLRPVAFRNGWNAVSLQRSLLRKKTAAQTSQAATDANGTAWVDLKTIAPTTSDIELYQLKMTVAGSWAGNAKYRIIVGNTKVYPFPADKNITPGTLESLIFPINIQINETAKIQFRSDNAGDGAGDTVTLDQLDYATVL